MGACRSVTVLAAALAFTGCGNLEPRDGPPPDGDRFTVAAEPQPRTEPLSRYGNPESYTVRGERYFVMDDSSGYVERGIASWYGSKFHGRLTSSREPYDMYAMTAAHRSLPLPTYARVTNLENGRTVVVRINDRGPFHPNRIIDLSYAAARRIGIEKSGTGLVEVRAIDPEVPGRDETIIRPAPRIAMATGQWQRIAVANEMVPKPQPVSLYLQVGAFHSRGNAERLQTRLTSNAIDPVLIDESDDKPDVVYRVRIGPVPGVEQADRLSERVVDMGLDRPQVVID